MSGSTTLLPFQPATMSNAQLAAFSYVARHSGHTHGLRWSAVFTLQRRSEMPDPPRWVCVLVRCPWLAAVGDLLDGPRVAVGIVEEHEAHVVELMPGHRALTELGDLANLHAVFE